MFKTVNYVEGVNVVHGFKIHISATSFNYKEIFQVVYPVLLEAGAPFKYIEKDEDVIANFSESEKPAESGKYITIYPSSRENCIALLELLYLTIPRDSSGIYLLSDRPYKDSQTIFYRYGFFEHRETDMVNGLPTLVGPNGEIWQDYQKTFFDLPSWIEDIQEEPTYQPSYLVEHYEIDQLLKRSNGGNIYRATCKKSDYKVVIKEARPHIVAYGTVDKKQLRENEFNLCQKLKGKKHVPTPVESVSEWINDYYIYEAIEGISLRECADKFSIFAFNSEVPLSNIDKFYKFLDVTKELLKLVQYFHQHNTILNDIHADNFIKTESNDWYYIDFENSYSSSGENLIGIYNEISLKEWNEINGFKADCYKVGNLLLYLLGRLQIRDLNDFHPNLIDELLHYYGIKTNFSEFISYLFSDRVTISGAIEYLEVVTVEKSTIRFVLDLDDCEEITEKVPADVLLDEVFMKPYLDKAYDMNGLQNLICRESNLGLDGLSGVLILINQGKLPKAILPMVEQKIIRGIAETEFGKAVSYGIGFASPYLHTGNAGVIKSLLFRDNIEDQSLILDLTNALLVEFAQYSDYRKGLLGVADTLIEVYQKYGGLSILQFVERQLMTTGIKAKFDPSIQTSYVYLLSRFRRIKNEIVFEKQVI